MSSMQKVYILLVEDDLVDRMACRRALAQDPDHEFVLYECETGREGLQLAHEQKPDCVLLDYHLPDMNGLEFLAELRSDLNETPVPVMMLTGADNASVAVESMKYGAQDYLVKDATRQYLELLPAVILRVLRERRALTEKKLMESRLIQAEARYRSLVEQIPAITYTAALDTPGKLTYVSPQLNALLGYSPEELIDQVGALRSYIHPDDRKLAADAFDAVRATGKPLHCEYRLLNRSGEVRWFLDEAKLVQDESGQTLQGILIDITADKRVEEELRQHRLHIDDLVNMRTTQLEKRAAVLDSANVNLSEKLGACIKDASALRKYADQLADFYHNAPCGCHALDADGVFSMINDTELEWLGHTREEVVGKIKFADLLTPASAKSFLESYDQFKSCGRIPDLELEIAHEEGNKPVLLCASGVKNASGQYVMSRAVMFDISARKRSS